jgi:hypothetical protein
MIDRCLKGATLYIYVLLTLLNFPLARAAQTPAARGEIRITRWRRGGEKVLKALFSDVFLIKSRFWFALRSDDDVLKCVFWESAGIFIHYTALGGAVPAFIMSLSFSIRTEHQSVSRRWFGGSRDEARDSHTRFSSRSPPIPQCPAVHFQTFRREKFVLSLHLPPLVFNSNAFVYPPPAEQASIV